MPLYRQTLLLFTLNFIDAVLTVYWVRKGIATEGNHLMATLLDIGDLPFFVVKIAMGGIAAMVLWNWGHMRLAKHGLTLALMLYIGLMGIHFFTGLSAIGLVSSNMVIDFSGLAETILSLII